MGGTSTSRCVDRAAARYGRLVSKRPNTTMAFSVIVGLLLATGTLTSLTFEARSAMLYVPQHSPLAKLRDDMWATFGAPPDPFVVTVSLVDGGDMITRDALLRVLSLHDAIVNATSLAEVGSNDFELPRVETTRYEDVCMQRYIPELGERFCAVSSVLQLWEYDRHSLEAATDDEIRTAVSEAYAAHEIDLGGVRRMPNSTKVGASALMMLYLLDSQIPAYDNGETAAWELHAWRLLRRNSGRPRRADGRRAAAAAAYAAHAMRVGGVTANVVDDEPNASPALARPAAGGLVAGRAGGGQSRGAPAARADARAPAAGGAADGAADTNSLAGLRINLYSRHINEFESEQFVSQDSYLMGLSVIAVILYVCFALSVANHGGGERGGRWWARLQRLVLGFMCGVSVGFSILAGFGLACFLGVPLTPVSPLVVFTLLGVSVDDMIIIFDCHVREAETDSEKLGELASEAGALLACGGALLPSRGARKAAKHGAMGAGLAIVDRGFERALSAASAAISLTSATTLIALLTGWAVDFPVYSFFCGATGCCILCCFFFQATLFAPLLLLHERTEYSHRVSLAVRHALAERKARPRDDGAARHAALEQPHVPLPLLVAHSSAPAPDEAGAGAWTRLVGGGDDEEHAAIELSPAPHKLGAGASPPASSGRSPAPTGCAHGARAHVAGMFSPRPESQATAGARGDARPGPPGSPPPPAPPPAPPPPAPPAIGASSPARSGRGADGGGGGAPAGEWADEAHARCNGTGDHAAGGGFGRAPASRELRFDDPPDGSAAPNGSCSQRLMRSYARVLLRPAVSWCVLVAFCALVVVCGVASRSLPVGLPQRDTVPDGSHVGAFLDDLDAFWAGDLPEQISFVFKCEQLHVMPDDEGGLPAGKLVVGRSQAAIEGLWGSGDMLRVTSNWADALDAWLHCPPDVPPALSLGGTCSAKNLTAFLSDREMHACTSESEHLASIGVVAGAPDARRRLQPARRARAPGVPATAPMRGRALRHRPAPAPPAAPADEEAAEEGVDAPSSSHGGGGGGGDGGGGTCADNEERFHSLSRGHACADALERCNTGFGHSIVKKLCPATCGLCTPGGHAPRGGGGGDGGGGGGSAEPPPIISLARGGLEFANDVVLRGQSDACACSDVDRAMRPDSAPCRVRWWQSGPLGVLAKLVARLAALARHSSLDDDEASALRAARARAPSAGRRLRVRRERHAAEGGAVQPSHHPNYTAIALAAAATRAASAPASPPARPRALGGGGARECSLGEIAAHRMVVSARMPQVHEQAYDQWLRFNQILVDAGARGYAYHHRYEFGYVDKRMLAFALTNLVSATVAILCVLLVFLSPTVALVSTAAVLSIDTILFGMMVVLDVRLNSITLISLLIALALAIDYSCHLGHAYEAAPFTDRRRKAAYALETMGASILSAGSSTLLGTLFLALSRSSVFRTFFVLVWGTILWGLVAGLAIVPAALSLFGPVGTDNVQHAPQPQRASHTPRAHSARTPSVTRVSVATSPRFAGRTLGGSPCAPAELPSPPPPLPASVGVSVSRCATDPSGARAGAIHRLQQSLPTVSRSEGSPTGWQTAPISPWYGGGVGAQREREHYPAQPPIPPIAGPIRPGQPPRGYDGHSASGAESPRYSSACRGALL